MNPEARLKARRLFPSSLVLRGFPAVWRFQVLPVGLALAALHRAEELLDEGLGFSFNCGNRRGQCQWRSPRARPEPAEALTLARPLTPPLREEVG